MRLEVMDMRALIVVESWFGNTLTIARAIAEGLGRSMTVDVCDVADAPVTIEAGIDLVVVGGPTHAFGMSRTSTQLDAAQKAGQSAAGRIGVRDWLASAPTGIRRAAAFDTRLNKGWVTGSAARGIAKQLRKLGATLVVGPESFRVVGSPGPLAAGEVERARHWGEQLAATLTTVGAPPSTQ